MKNVIFDFGNVIVQWQPFRALNGVFETVEDMNTTLDQIGFYDWNLEQDRGRSFDDALAAAKRDTPDHLHVFEAYFDGLLAAHDQLIPGTSELITELHGRGVNLYGLTNAARPSYEIVRSVAPVVGLLQDVVVSGDERIIKPDPDIFHLCLNRNGLVADETLFVDDSLANCQAAETVGITAHHFKHAAGLEADLKKHGLLQKG